MAAYSQDLRERVLNGYDRGERPADIAQRLEVSKTWVHSVYKRFKETGERSAHRLGGYRIPCLLSWEETIRSWIAEKPDLTLSEMVDRLAENGVEVGISTMWRQLDKWGLRFKKNAARPRTEPPGYSGTARGVEGRTSRMGCWESGFSG